MINWKNNFIFLAIHFVVCLLMFLVFWRALVSVSLAIIACIAYVGSAYLLSGNVIQIGNQKHNIGSVLFLAIILVLLALFCILMSSYSQKSNDWGIVMSFFIWLVYSFALGPFSPFAVAIGVLSLAEGMGRMEGMEGIYAILSLFVALIPSLLFWLGIELKALYLRRKAG